jgi:cytochrome c oxidase subunit 3
MIVTARANVETAERWHLREIGLWMFLGTLVMLFAAFTSAMVVRRGSSDWRGIDLPTLLWLNTAAIAASSVSLEYAKARGMTAPRMAVAGLGLTCVLGLGFLAGQLLAWRDLIDAGVFLSSSPHGSFFYILSGVHGVHLAAALVLLLYLFAKTVRGANAAEWPFLVGLVSTFWHFLAGTWLYLLILLRVV